MRIQEAASHLGVSTRTLRHYEAAGLIRPNRLGNGYRSLSEADLRQAEWVRDLVAAGFSTRELRMLAMAVKDGLPESTCVAMLRDKLGQIDCLAALLEQRRHAVAERLAVQEDVARQSTRPSAAKEEAPSHERPEYSGSALSPARPLRRGRGFP